MFREALSVISLVYFALVAAIVWDIAKPYPRVCPRGSRPSINRTGCWACFALGDCEAVPSVQLRTGEYEVSDWILKALLCATVAILGCTAGLAAEEYDRKTAL